jgi:hypothetical protein
MFPFPTFEASLLLEAGISLVLGLRAFWVSERLLPLAKRAGYQGFNRCWGRGRAVWRWPVRLLVLGEWLLLAALLPLSTPIFAGVTLLGGGALLVLVQAEPAAQRLRLSYHRQAWQNFRRSRRTAGALWLLKACVLGMLALLLFE